MTSKSKPTWILILMLTAVACGGSESEDGAGTLAESNETETSAASANDTQGLQAETVESSDGGVSDQESGAEVDSGTDVLDDVGFDLSSTGGVEFDHSGEALCTVTQGQLDVEFYPDQESDVFYRFSTVGFSADKTNYAVAFVVEGEGGESMGSGLMEAATSDAGDGVLFFSGDLTVGFSGGAGDGLVEGTLGCLIEGT